METRISPNTTTTSYGSHVSEVHTGATNSNSAVSWAAIFAGAAAAAALSLILLILGMGLGMASVSPWANDGVSGKTFSIGTIAWITVTSLLASALGGYIAGRLRTRWINTDLDEVHFRDTAHGFLAWAIATLATATLLTSVISSIVGAGAQAGATVAGSAVAATATTAAAATAAHTADVKTDGDNSLPYFLDSLFRKEVAAVNADAPAGAMSPAAAGAAAPMTPPQPQPNTAASKSEVGRIFVNAISTGSMSPADTRYVGQVVAQATGVSQQDAEKRVTDTFNAVQKKLSDAETAAREAADKARKASAYGSLWLFISLLIGAFAASLCATFGGRQRDL